MNKRSAHCPRRATILSLHHRSVVTASARSMRMDKIRIAKFQIGQVVRHRVYPFRGVVFDIDPVFANTEEWYDSIPAEVRPHKDQPFYHLFAENDETEYIAYVSEQNLLPDNSGEPVRHPQVAEVFVKAGKGFYRPRSVMRH
jgi:heat shock protein HspQ